MISQGQILVFWTSGRLQEEVAQGGSTVSTEQFYPTPGELFGRIVHGLYFFVTAFFQSGI